MSSYIHGTHPSEQQRLALLNTVTNRAFADFLGIEPGMRVLEVGSGLGILAAEVASRGAEVTGVERAPAQIEAATRSPRVTYVHGDAHQLEFPDASFDLVYARYVLEHVADPERVLREMRRVARPGARVAVCENDISLMRMDPPCPAFESVWRAFAELQATLGGDGLIGRRLYRLFRNAGFEDIRLSLQPEVHWAGEDGFEPWIRVVIGNIEEQPLSGVEDAVAELEALLRRDDASCIFAWNRALAVRP